MILINLLPHREAKRKRKQQLFVAGLVASAAIGVLAGGAWLGVVKQQISTQVTRNDVLSQEITRLESQIKDVATLREEIDKLRARQMAVENLQADRNAPVILLNELAGLTPEGVYLNSVKQDGDVVGVAGVAQTNERVAEYLRKLGGAEWVARTDLIEITNRERNGKERPGTANLYDFSMKVTVRRPKPPEPLSGGASAPAPATKTADAPAPGGRG